MINFLVTAVKLGVGGFSMGAATALYSATCCIYGKYGNGSQFPIHISAVIGLSGWLPCSRFTSTLIRFDFCHVCFQVPLSIFFLIVLFISVKFHASLLNFLGA